MHRYKSVDLPSRPEKNQSRIMANSRETRKAIVKVITIQRTQRFLGTAERWMTFPGDKSILGKYMIMQKQLLN